MAQQKTSFITHKGHAVYPWLNKPDTEYNSDGIYKTGLRVPGDQIQQLIKSAEEVAQDEFGNKASKARMPWKIDQDTGEYILNAKSKYPPKVYDAEGQVIPPEKLPQIWGGSILRLGGNINPYNTAGNMGISLQLNKVQIVELSELTYNDDGSGFEAVDGGGFTIASVENDNHEKQQEPEEAFAGDF